MSSSDPAPPSSPLPLDPPSLLRNCLLALCVWREARGEPFEGQQWVAQVIKNRTADPRWPHSYRDVILQPYQFSSFNRTDPEVTLYPREDDPSWASCAQAAWAVEQGDTPLTDANLYCTETVHPSWADHATFVGQVGHHRFYRE